MTVTETELDPLARFRLEDKVAIVTGASSGLGSRFARVLDAAGAKVVLVARRQERLQQLASELGDALPVAFDLADVGQIPQAGYAASKGGLVNLTRELAAQWSRKGIRVNALAPGWFESEMTADMFSEEGKGRDWVARRAPMARHGREGELDGALLFLASDASSYVTGQVLAVDGGWTAI